MNISGTAGAHAQFAVEPFHFDSLIFTNTSTASVVGCNGANNNLNYVEYKGSGNVYKPRAIPSIHWYSSPVRSILSLPVLLPISLMNGLQAVPHAA